MTKSAIESWFLDHQGYLKKNSEIAAKALWKSSSKHTLPKTHKELLKELEQIKQVQSDLRKAKTIQSEVQDTKLVDIYQKILDEKNRPRKILLLDIETSGNIVHTFQVGYKVNIPYDSILQERSVICVAYQWLGDNKIYSLQWDNNKDDKELLTKFTKVIGEADIIVHQNGERFDVPWLRTRCIYHHIPFPSKINQIDTYKWAKYNLYLNSNSLDYMGKFFGVGGKKENPKGLWIDVVWKNDRKALKQMVDYCKVDIEKLREVYNILKPYMMEKKFKYKI